jgi:hypothetical protein
VILGSFGSARAGLALAACLLASLASAQQPTRVVVLGHIRGAPDGRLNYLIPKLVEDLRALRPDAVVMTGDMIWGDWGAPRADRARVTAEWDQLDAAFAAIEAPIYRVPGNHDLHDRVTRDLFRERYGALPRVETVKGCRLLLLNSCWTPADDDDRSNVSYRGVDLDARQIEFLERELGSGAAKGKTFAFLHHVIWWAGGAPWWRDVHPVLRRGGVRAVFGGDYGPYKVSHVARDGIDYMHCAIATEPEVAQMRSREQWRLLGQQPDCYLLVTVDGDDVDIDVRTVGVVGTGNFSPERWWSVYAYEPGWLSDFYHRRLGSPRAALEAAAIAVGAAFAGGLLVAFVVSSAWRRWRRRNRPSSAS